MTAFDGDGQTESQRPPGFDGYGGEDLNGSKQIWNQSELNGTAWDSSENRQAKVGSQEGVGKRSNSFSNLAAVLGTGLVESMDDSTRDQQQQHSIWEGRGGLVGVFDAQQDLSYARHVRHKASRLIGTPSTAANTGGLMTSVFSQPKVRSDPPTSAATAAAFGGATSQAGVFSLSDSDPLVDFKSSTQFRQPPALELFGQSDSFNTSSVGVTVMEPMELIGRNSAPPELFGDFSTPRQGTPDLGELQRGMQTLELERRNSYRSAGSHDDVSLDLSLHASESELHRFCWDVRSSEPSRCLTIFRADCVLMSDIRSTCEAFGVLEMFRSDFDERGVIFVGYYDIRSAQHAALELKQCLRRLDADDGGYNNSIDVKYCVPLNSSSAQDESTLVFSDLPPSINENTLMSILSSFGAVRSVKRQAGSHYGANQSYSYNVEFHSIQDAKQALLELESTQPWGPGIVIEVGMRSAAERQRGRELLALLGRWREGRRSSHSSPVSGGRLTPLSAGRLTPTSPGTPRDWTPVRTPIGVETKPTARRGLPTAVSPSPMLPNPPNLGLVGSETSFSTPKRHAESREANQDPHQATQVVIGPDGRYSYVVVNHTYQSGPPPAPTHHMDPHGGAMGVGAPQHIVHGPHGAFVSSVPHNSMPPQHANAHGQMHYWAHPGHPHPQYHPVPHGATVVTTAPYQVDGGRVYQPGTAPMPYYAHVVTNPTDSSVSSGSGSNSNVVSGGNPRRAPNSSNNDDKDTRHLMLNIDAVESGRDTRTSLMVRNIPNKYTQQMLLSEFTENGHGPGKIDFFYLPIDFKNKCNRGYAFVNFVDYRDIVPFHRQYFGQHWRVFNSDKICDITYARIQGKAGMLKRFENSALMEKDDEYKPLVFVSHGNKKGQRVPFPDNSSS